MRLSGIRSMVLLGVLLSLLACAIAMAQQTAKALLDQAQTQKAAGDLQGATDSFERIAAEFAASDRNAAAKALLGLGEITESLGQRSRSRGYYERVRDEFKDQAAEASLASERLSKVNANTPTRENVSKITVKTPFTKDVYSFALSPDGKTLVFQGTAPDGKNLLWRQAVDVSQKPEPIAGTEGAGEVAYPFFSPDGKSILFFANQRLLQVDLAGGTPKDLAPARTPNGGSWRGGPVLFSGQGLRGSLEVLESGALRNVSPTPGLYVVPRFVDDRRYLYIARARGGDTSIEMGALDGAPVSAGGFPAAIAADFAAGFLFFVTPQGRLNAIPVDTGSLAVTGAPAVVAESVGREDRRPGTAAFSVSANGSVAYREVASAKRQMVWMDRTGALLATVGVPDAALPESPRLSPDGRTVLYFRQQGSSTGSMWGSVWAMDTESGARRMFQDAAVGGVWSPRGDQVTLSTFTVTGAKLTSRTIGGGQSAELPVQRNTGAIGGVFPDDWDEAGNILYRLGRPVEATFGGDLFVLPPDRGAPIPIAQSAASELNGRISPDSRWVAYQSDETGGRFEIYVQAFPGTVSERQRVSLNGGTNPQWGSNGELFFLAPDNRLMAVSAKTETVGGKPSIDFATPKPLFSTPLPLGSEYDVDRRTGRFLVLTPTEDAPPIIVIPNWTAGRGGPVVQTTVNGPSVVTPARANAVAGNQTGSLNAVLETLQRSAASLSAANAQLRADSTDRAIADLTTASALTRSAIAHVNAHPETAGAAPSAVLPAAKPDFAGQRVRGQRVNVDRALDDMSRAFDQIVRSPGGDLGGVRQQIADAIASAARSILNGAAAATGNAGRGNAGRGNAGRGNRG